MRKRASIYYEMGDNSKSAQYYQEYYALNDSIQITNEDIAAGEFAAMLGVERLNLEKSELQQQVQQRDLVNKQRIIIFLIVLLSLVFIIFYREHLLYSRLRISQKQLSEKNKELVRSQEELKHAKEQAEEGSRMKSEFIQNMSHEIRTPLNALSGFSAILTDANIDISTRQQCNEIIQQNSDLLLKLIDDVVDLSSLEIGKMQFLFANNNAVAICRNVVDTVEKIKQTSASVLFQTSLENLEIYTDEARLQQLLINLLINATKFTTEGSITLSLEKQSEEVALFAVSDTGCGIAPEKQGAIFNRFEKLNENAQGSGLGLSICQLIVERFGGKIWIDPEYKNGSRFLFTHPIVSTSRKEVSE